MFNYRVAAFGFLASEKIRANGDLNAGLLDQQLLFRWVKKYIQQVCFFYTISRYNLPNANTLRQFGGDPDHVVIHGASAGAGSVALHLLA